MRRADARLMFSTTGVNSDANVHANAGRRNRAGSGFEPRTKYVTTFATRVAGFFIVGGSPRGADRADTRFLAVATILTELLTKARQKVSSGRKRRFDTFFLVFRE